MDNQFRHDHRPDHGNDNRHRIADDPGRRPDCAHPSPVEPVAVRGLPIQKYTFAIWTETQPGAGIQDVGSFVPEDR